MRGVDPPAQPPFLLTHPLILHALRTTGNVSGLNRTIPSPAGRPITGAIQVSPRLWVQGVDRGVSAQIQTRYKEVDVRPVQPRSSVPFHTLELSLRNTGSFACVSTARARTLRTTSALFET